MTRDNQVSRHDGVSHKVASRQGQAQRMQEVEEYETGTKASAQVNHFPLFPKTFLLYSKNLPFSKSCQFQHQKSPLQILLFLTPHPKAGLNLNLFAAVSGVFGSKSKKTTDTDPDGSSHSVEDTEGVGHVKGAGGGNLKAAGSAQANDYQKKTKSVEQKQSQRQEQVESVDHLGIVLR